MTQESVAPVRVEREGDLAVVVLDRPPLNLFDESVFAAVEVALERLAELTAPGAPDRARAALFEARGRIVSGEGAHLHRRAQSSSCAARVGGGQPYPP